MSKKNKIPNNELVSFLKNKTHASSSFIDKLKIAYRPYICPFNELLEHIPENSSVFDIGCGSGMFLSLVQEFKNPSKVFGIEISSELVQHANNMFQNSAAKNYTFSVFNGSTIPDEISTYNYVFMIDVLHHVPKNQQYSFLQELYNKISPSTTFVLKDINASNIFVYWNKLHDAIIAKEIGHELKPTPLIQYLKKIGFKNIQISYKQMFLYPHFTITCNK